MGSIDRSAGLPPAASAAPDGFVRVSLDAILRTPMVHLISGLEPLSSRLDRCGQATTISGYTEWVSEDRPQLSLGWDWRLEYIAGPAGLVRVGLPRSNVMLVDARGGDYGWHRNLEILATVVDALPWRNSTDRALAICTL